MANLQPIGAVRSTIALSSLLCVPTVLTYAAESNPLTGGFALDEVVVTATKRSESIQNVPLSVSVVSEEALQSQNLANTADLQRLVPGLQFLPSGSPANTVFGIRGVSTLATSQGLEQSAGVAFDGVPLGRTLGSIADLVDIKAVEALKGPQGMLFGKNASAGLINIVSNSPELNKTEELFRVSYGSRNNQQYTGTANWAVTDESALRVTAWKFKHDGNIHEVNTGQDMNDKNSAGGRLKYRWQPTDALNLNFSADWTSHNENGAGYTIRKFVPSRFNAGNAGQIIYDWETSHGTVPSDRNLTARGADLPYYDKGHTGAYTGQADYSLAGGTLTTIVSYRKIYNDNEFESYPTDNPAIHLFPNHDTVNYDQLSEEVHYASPIEDRFHYVVGLFNFRLKLNDQQQIGFNLYTPGGDLGVINDTFVTNLKNDNYAAFGEATFAVTNKLNFIAGLRRSSDKVSESMDRAALAPEILGFSSPGASYGLFSASASTSYNDVSWRTGLQYQFLPDAMLYATASRGYKGPGIGFVIDSTASTLALSNNSVVKPEIVHAYEVGIKSQWFDRRLRANLAIYDEIFDNFQTSVQVPTSTGFPIVAIQNAGQARTTGVDLDINWLLTSAFSLSVGGTYDDARYTDFKNAACYSTYQTQAQGCVNRVQDLDGERLASTPKVTTNVTARYEHLVGNTLRAFFQANHNYRSSVIFSSTGDPDTIQGGYSLVNLSTGIGNVDGRWDVTLTATNVFDKHYVDRIGTGPSNGSAFFYLNNIGFQDLRNYGIAVNARF